MYTYHEYHRFQYKADDPSPLNYFTYKDANSDKENDLVPIYIENSVMVPIMVDLYFDKSNEAFYFIKGFTNNPNFEWHVFGRGRDVSSCVEFKDKLNFYKTNLGIIGIPR